MSVLDTLITDRTPADVQARAQLQEKVMTQTATEAELTQWLTDLKGAYNDSDLNRVGEAITFLLDYFNGMNNTITTTRDQYGVATDSLWYFDFPVPDLAPKTDWTQQDIPNADQMAEYLDNVDAVTNIMPINKDLPASIGYLGLDGANGIEEALLTEYDAGEQWLQEKQELIEKASRSWVYSGQPPCGLVNLQFGG